MEGSIFIKINEVKFLLGCSQYNTALRLHVKIRKHFRKESKYITIKEFCSYMGLEFDYVWQILRGKENP